MDRQRNKHIADKSREIRDEKKSLSLAQRINKDGASLYAVMKTKRLRVISQRVSD